MPPIVVSMADKASFLGEALGIAIRQVSQRAYAHPRVLDHVGSPKPNFLTFVLNIAQDQGLSAC
jgi:hypothetical protein